MQDARSCVGHGEFLRPPWRAGRSREEASPKELRHFQAGLVLGLKGEIVSRFRDQLGRCHLCWVADPGLSPFGIASSGQHCHFRERPFGPPIAVRNRSGI